LADNQQFVIAIAPNWCGSSIPSACYFCRTALITCNLVELSLKCHLNAFCRLATATAKEIKIKLRAVLLGFLWFRFSFTPPSLDFPRFFLFFCWHEAHIKISMRA